LVSEYLDQVTSWILHSGIQNTDGEIKGSVNAWFDLKKKGYSYVYTEITGYAITTFLFLYALSKEELLLTRAEEAAHWIMGSALHPCGGVRARLYLDEDLKNEIFSFEEENVFTFDTGMVLFGMINLYKVTHKQTYLETAQTMAKFVIQKMQNDNGSLSAMYD